MPDVLQYGFMVRALAAGALLGMVCPALGTFLVLRRLALIADTLAHVALAGAAVGVALNQAPTVVALAASAGAALAIEWLRSTGRLHGDAALALFLYAALALAVVVMGLAQSFNAGFLSLLFGNVLTVSEADVWLTAAMAAVALGAVAVLYEDLAQVTFDPDLAHVSGVPVARANLVLALLTGVVVALGMRLVGVLLVGALLVMPVTASLQVSRSFRTTLLGATSIGLASAVAGLMAAFSWDLAAGGAVVLAALLALALATGVRWARGLLARRGTVQA